MSYVAPRTTGRTVRRIHVVKRRPPALSDWFDDLTSAIGGGFNRITGLGPPDSSQFEEAQAAAEAQQNAELAACLSQANDQVATLDAEINQLSVSWNPSGFYTPSAITQIALMGLGLVQQAQDALTATSDQSLSSDQRSQIADAADQLHRKGQDSADFTTKIDPSAQAVEAPGFKRWVITTMQACRDAFTVASFVNCTRPGWMSVVGIFIAAFEVWKAGLLAMKDAVVDLGQKIQKIPDTVSTLYQFAKVGILVGLGYVIYTEYKKHAG
jgi:hypothetical protein